LKNFLTIIVCSGLLLFLTGCTFSCDFGDDTVNNVTDGNNGTEQKAE